MKQLNTLNLVYAISFLDLLAVGLTFPLFGNHLRDLGASHTVIGLLGSTYSGVQVLSGPLIGAWSDVRDRKTVLKVTLLLCAICYGLVGITGSIFIIFIVRFILGVVKHTQSICKAVIIDLVPLSDHTKAFGRSAAFGSLGFIIGPFIGGHLSEVQNGFTYISALTSVLFIINLVFAFFLPSTKEEKKTANNQSIIKGVKDECIKTVEELRNINWEEHWESFLLRFLFGLSLTCYFSNQSLYMKEKYLLSQKHSGYIISFFSTAGMISAFFIDFINNYYKNDESCYTRLFHFFAIMSLCFIGISVSQSFWLFLLLLVPFAIVSTFLRVVSMELMLKKSDEEHKGSLSGASNSIMSIARFISPLITGLFSDIFSEQSVMLLAVVPAAAGMCFSWHKQKNVQKFNKNR